jgi:agmatine deiminase
MSKDRVSSNSPKVRIPADWEPHACCWMAWAVDPRDWDADKKVKCELSEVIQTIARYEPVRVLALRGPELREAQREFATCRNVTVIEAPVDDIWMRDIAPTFGVRGQGAAQEVVAIDWNFNGWGGTLDRPPRAGDQLAKAAAAVFGVPRLSVPFVAEGGALVTDGHSTMVTTRSCLLNPNRNPVRRGINRQHVIETETGKLGISKVIWLEGDPCEPITSGHIDGYVLCAPSGQVLVDVCDDKTVEPPMWREHDIALLENATNADGCAFKVARVSSPRQRYWRGDPETFAASYLNAYVANGAVIGARFGDPQRDAAAKHTLAKAFPWHEIIMLRIDHIADGGGGIHCLTQPYWEVKEVK